MRNSISQLPAGWISGSLREFVEPTGERVSPADFPDARFIGMDNVESKTTKILGTVPAREMKSSAARFHAGNVLYGRLRPYLNKVTRPTFDGLASAEFIVFADSELLRSAFLKYRLNAADFVNFSSHLNEGDRPRVGFDQLGDYKVLLPPPREQVRIVARLEELFSELEKGVESIELARRQFILYEHCVLKKAFSGDLTARWRLQQDSGHQSTKDLIQCLNTQRESRYRDGIARWQFAIDTWNKAGRAGAKPSKPACPPSVEPIGGEEAMHLPALPDGWAWVRLGSLADISGGLTKNEQKRKLLPRRMKYLRVANVYADRLDLDDVQEIRVTDDEAEKVTLCRGDILVVEGNGSVEQIGRVAMWSDELPDCGHQNHLIRVRLQTDVFPRFILRFLLSPLGRHIIVKQASSTSGLHTLSISKVAGLPVPVATRAEQAAVLDLVDAGLSRVQALRFEIDDQLSRAGMLRESIMAKAFSGKLVPQDPAEESASVVLARTRAGREHASSFSCNKMREQRAGVA